MLKLNEYHIETSHGHVCALSNTALVVLVPQTDTLSSDSCIRCVSKFCYKNCHGKYRWRNALKYMKFSDMCVKFKCLLLNGECF